MLVDCNCAVLTWIYHHHNVGLRAHNQFFGWLFSTNREIANVLLEDMRNPKLFLAVASLVILQVHE
jgi:hypothetical protein